MGDTCTVMTRGTINIRILDGHLGVICVAHLRMRLIFITFHLLLLSWPIRSYTFYRLNGTEAIRYVNYLNTLRQWVTPPARAMNFIVSLAFIYISCMLF